MIWELLRQPSFGVWKSNLHSKGRSELRNERNSIREKGKDLRETGGPVSKFGVNFTSE